jgi:hypothetical protein
VQRLDANLVSVHVAITSLKPIAALLMLCSVMLGGGCQSRQNGTPLLPVYDPSVGDQASWPFWPSAMRFHPLTRVLESEHTSEIIIEARVEFSDVSGSTSKCVGRIWLRLMEGGSLLEEWTVDLRDMATNALRFDDITRTYLFRLEIAPENYSASAELHADFLSVNGAELQARHTLRR